ncbi:MAG: sulfurtransferase TusA family protein [Desulfobacterales bacterium]|nr:sulfurtransferase TusA family protein [Desulfobacterales bacterium]MBF0398942.1 sulfurtransferase TusA family protein [Desulfobacterales bacterium]
MIIDACGLSCPQPVILAMNAIKDNKSYFQIIVDSNVASENVKRLAESKGYNIQMEIIDEKIQLTLTK